MSMVAKILIVLNLILAVAVMGAAGAYLQSAENFKKQYSDSKAQLEGTIKDLNERIQKTQSGLDEANRKASAAVQEKNTAEAALKTMSENNTLQQKKWDDLNASYQGIDAKFRDLQGNLEAARQANDKLQGEKKQAEDEKRGALEAKNAAETELKRVQLELDGTAANLDAAVKNGVALVEKLEATSTALDMYRSKYPSPGLPVAPVKGQVLAADPSIDIYLISVGEKDGVKVADELTVFRGDQFVAVVVVDKVFADKASVVVKRMNGKPLKKSDIKQGDKVATVF